MNKKISSTLFVLVLGLFIISSQAQAATATATLDVSATVGVACSVSATPANFGQWQGALIQTTGFLTVTCPSGIPFNIALDAGQNYDGFLRIVSNGTDRLYYGFLDPSGTYEVGDSDYAGTYSLGLSFPGTGTGSPQPIDIIAILPVWVNTAFVSDGSYTDVVGVTVHY
jgi:spore coat protein U-like protein